MKNPPRMRPGVKAFIVHNGKILVAKEKFIERGKERIIYDIPGGGIDPGETLHEALRREVMEEVGLEVEVEQPVGGWDFTFYNDTTKEEVHVINVAYQCRLIGEPNIDTTHNPALYENIFETGWMSKEELLGEKLFGHEDMFKALENVRIDS